MRILLHNRSNYGNLKTNLLVQEKALKIKESLQFQQKKNLQELTKMKKKFFKKISYVLHFIDNARFLAISNLVNNSSEVIHRIK